MLCCVVLSRLDWARDERWEMRGLGNGLCRESRPGFRRMMRMSQERERVGWKGWTGWIGFGREEIGGLPDRMEWNGKVRFVGGGAELWGRGGRWDGRVGKMGRRYLGDRM